MIAINYKGLAAAFDPDTLTWSGDEVLSQVLNDSLVIRDPFRVESCYAEGPRDTVGHDGIALADAIELLGEEIAVTQYERVDPPAEQKGVVV
jgi:hypothetical protein